MEKRIVLVDDEPAALRVLVRAVKPLAQAGGIPNESFDDPLLATARITQLLQQQVVVFLVTDFNMPSMTGLQLIQAVRGRESYHRQCQAVVFSADSGGRNRTDVVAAGEKFLDKLTDQPAILNLVREFIAS
ncbi:MAG: response regulator [Candidatus Uhrbacteria bacterium]|nr:response regulator [Candidatus Uhrbacteria bacterium]